MLLFSAYKKRILIEKLDAHGFVSELSQLIDNRLSYRKQRVVLNARAENVLSGVPQGSMVVRCVCHHRDSSRQHCCKFQSQMHASLTHETEMIVFAQIGSLVERVQGPYAELENVIEVDRDMNVILEYELGRDRTFPEQVRGRL